VADFNSLPSLRKALQSLWPQNCDDIKLYDLVALVPEVTNDPSSEEVCSLFFKKVVVGMQEVDITVRKGVPHFAHLYPLYCSTDQRPDLTVFRRADKLPLILVEVHSSPFQATVRKLIFGVIDQLRLYRTYNTRITQCVGFAFPKLHMQQCVIKVSVKWEHMVFSYTLTPITNSECVMDCVATQLRTVTAEAPSSGLNQELRFLVPLSQEDLSMFGDGATGSPVQLPSRAATLVRHGIDYFKAPAHYVEVMQLLTMAGNSTPPPATIRLQQLWVGRHKFFTYTGVPYGPLTCTEAHNCLYNLVPQLVRIVQSLHASGWAHQDIRLENICFNTAFRPVFIDLDRCTAAHESGWHGDSCMYDMLGSASQTDWLQLGLMVCWVLDPGLGLKPGEEGAGTYHTRNCKQLSKSLVDPFLKSLIDTGTFQQDHFEAWCTTGTTANSQTVADVLKQRPH
jgi:hypothetical protein